MRLSIKFSTAPPKILMPTVTDDLPPRVNHVFVDFENVHEIDHSVIGRKTVAFTLLVGSRQTKLDASLVEKLFEHAVSVQLVRLTSPGKNALDFALAYYVGRAVAGDPTGYFHIISKDAGYDPLIQHLRSSHISARRHDSFETLTFAAPPKPATPAPPSATPKSPAKSKAKTAILDQRESQVLEHWRKPSATRPRTQKTLVSFLIAHLGNKITEAEALNLIEYLGQGGHVTIGENTRVTYHLASK
jgi:hypothetical protein